MLGKTLLEEDFTPSDGSDLLVLLQGQLLDLLLIHLQQSLLGNIEGSTHVLPLMYLKECRYVYGEKSAARSSMRYALRVGPGAEAGAADEMLTLELSVKPRRTELC